MQCVKLIADRKGTELTDLSQTIEAKSNQLNADDLISGPRTITITKVRANPESKEQPIAINFEGDNGKPFLPCKSMRRVLVHVWGKDGASYVGRSLTLYRDPTVLWGGVAVAGVRISHMSEIKNDVTISLTANNKSRKPFTVKPLAVTPAHPAPPTQDTPPEMTETEAMQHATVAAKKGTDSFREWWNTEQGIACRTLIKPKIDELKAIAAKADIPTDDDFPL